MRPVRFTQEELDTLKRDIEVEYMSLIVDGLSTGSAALFDLYAAAANATVCLPHRASAHPTRKYRIHTHGCLYASDMQRLVNRYCDILSGSELGWGDRRYFRRLLRTSKKLLRAVRYEERKKCLAA